MNHLDKKETADYRKLKNTGNNCIKTWAMNNSNNFHFFVKNIS